LSYGRLSDNSVTFLADLHIFWNIKFQYLRIFQ